MWYNLWSMKSKNSKTEKVNKEDSNKSLLTKYARKSDKADADKEDGEGMKIPKTKVKKKTNIVALKHKAVLDKIGAKKNVGNSKKKESLYQAMIEEGYSPSYARSGGVGSTKSWNKLIEERLSDEKLSYIHQTLVVAKKLDYMLFNPEVPDEAIYELIDSVGCVLKKLIHGVAGTHAYYFAPDNNSKIKALELAYKIRGKMAPEVLEIRKGLEGMTDEELAEVIKKQKNKFTKND